MKNIIAFFVMIYNWFISLFKKEKKEKKTLKDLYDENFEKSNSKILNKIQKMIPSHNNRRNTRGRFTQYTPSGRAIYHGAK